MAGPDIFILTKWSPAAPAINVAPTELFQWAWRAGGGEGGEGVNNTMSESIF